MSLRITPFRKSASRKTLFMGCDRELLLISVPLFATLGFMPMSFIAAGVAVALWFLTFFSLRMMAKIDPQLRVIYLRYINNYGQNFYPAKSTPFNSPNIDLKR